jgi:phosphoglycolate phosphatase
MPQNPASPNPPLIVFDLDGTLVDSAPDLIDTLNVIIGREGLAPLPLEQGRTYVGRGGKIMLRRGLAAGGMEVSDARLDELFAAFLAYYDDHLTVKTRFYPGVEAALDGLAAAGHGLAICTNKIERPSKKLIAELGATARFRAICGQDTFPVSKPNAGALRLTIEKAGGDPARAIMVGDTETDILTAKAAGLPVIAVDFGYAPEPVAKLGPDIVISHFDELNAAVEAMTAKLPA